MLTEVKKGFEWLLDLAEKAEKSATNTYIKTTKISIKDKLTAEYSLKVKVGLNNPRLPLQ